MPALPFYVSAEYHVAKQRRILLQTLRSICIAMKFTHRSVGPKKGNIGNGYIPPDSARPRQSSQSTENRRRKKRWSGARLVDAPIEGRFTISDLTHPRSA